MPELIVVSSFTIQLLLNLFQVSDMGCMVAEIVSSPKSAGVGQFSKRIKIFTWIAPRTCHEAIFAVVVVPRRNTSFCNDDFKTINTSGCKTVRHSSKVRDPGGCDFSIRPIGFDLTFACVICKGTATAIEPVDNVLVGFDLLVISIGHQALRIFCPHSRYVEISVAAWKEVVVEGIAGIDMGESFFSFID